MRLPEITPGGRDQSPVYRQIAEHIRGCVAEGELTAGVRLPPIRSLASRLGVNRDTVALAYDSLVREGVLESTVGRGTFVRAPAPGGPPLPPAPLALASQVERLLALENSRPRFSASRDVVALHSLVPDPAFFPVEAFRKALNRAIKQGGGELFLYGAPAGHPRLRELLSERMAAVGISARPEEIVSTHGASQGIALAVRLFAERGDAVAVEEPTYHNVLATLLALGVEPVPVPMTGAGPDLGVLDRLLASERVRAFYTIPTFHNPMGTTTAHAHRVALLGLARRHGKPLIEDAFESDLRFAGREVPSLCALDDSGLVVHLSSFSKSLFPGARAGALVARGRAVEALLALKHATDLSDSMPLQLGLAEFLETGGYDKHLAAMRRELRVRRDALLEAVAEYLPEGTTATKPEGGYQVWVEMPFAVDTRDLLADAVRAGVCFAPGSQFLVDGRSSSGLRLTFARAGAEEIRRGVAALGQVIRERREADPARSAASQIHI